MEHVTNALSRLSSVLTKYIGMIIICFSVIAFFWRDGFTWTTNSVSYTHLTLPTTRSV